MMPDGDQPERGRPALPTVPTRFVANRRKFSAYVLVPGEKSGKDGVFIDLLGFRARSEDDALTLAETYMAQARERFLAGEVTPALADGYGQRYTIVVEIRGVRLRTGWIFRPDGTLWLVTPFTGFAR